MSASWPSYGPSQFFIIAFKNIQALLAPGPPRPPRPRPPVASPVSAPRTPGLGALAARRVSPSVSACPAHLRHAAFRSDVVLLDQPPRKRTRSPLSSLLRLYSPPSAHHPLLVRYLFIVSFRAEVFRKQEYRPLLYTATSPRPGA